MLRKSDLSDKIIDSADKRGTQVDTEPQDSPQYFSRQLDYENVMTHKSDRDIGTDFAELSAGAEDKNDSESKLPVVNYFVPLLVSPTSIMDIFKQVSKQQNFQIIEKKESYATAVFKEPFSFKKFIFKCVPVFGEDGDEDGSVSAIRILISVNEAKSCRKICLQGLYGNYAALKTFFKFFNRKIQNKLNKGIPKSQRGKRKSSGKLTFDNNFNEISLISEEESKSQYNGDSENGLGNSESNNQKFTYYYYHKILSSDQYSLGKKVSIFVDSFNNEYNTAEEGMKELPKSMNETCFMTNDIVKSLYSTYNISGNNKNLMQFSRSSVEKYLFGKIYPKLFEMYKLKYKESDETFEKRSMITKATDPISMLKHLGVNKKYIICDGFRFSNSASKYDFKTKLPDESLESSNISGEENTSEISTPRIEQRSYDGDLMPYHESIKALERISSFTSPREKLD